MLISGDRIYNKRNMILMCAGLWIICMFLDLSNFVGWGYHSFDKKNFVCIWDRTADFSYTLFLICVGVGLPIIVTALCYIRIFLHVRNSKLKVKRSKFTLLFTSSVSQLDVILLSLCIVHQ